MRPTDRTPPSAERVARRALVLAALHERSLLAEHGDREQAEEIRGLLCQRLRDLDLWSEAEAEEQDYLALPIGAARRSLNVDAWWRLEGLAALCWALGLTDALPSYDEGADYAALPIDPWDDGAAALIADATLRDAAALHGLTRQVTVVRWRINEWRRSPGRFDFRAYLEQHACFRPGWLDGLEFSADGELAVSPGFDAEGTALLPRAPIDELSRDSLSSCNSINVERQTAAYWLEGDEATYSEVRTPTVLTGLDPLGDAEDRRQTARLDRAAAAMAARAVARARAADSVEQLSDGELLARLVTLEPRLKRFEKIALPDMQRSAQAGGLSAGQRAQAARILAKHA